MLKINTCNDNQSDSEGPEVDASFVSANVYYVALQNLVKNTLLSRKPNKTLYNILWFRSTGTEKKCLKFCFQRFFSNKWFVVALKIKRLMPFFISVSLHSLYLIT